MRHEIDVPSMEVTTPCPRGIVETGVSGAERQDHCWQMYFESARQPGIKYFVLQSHPAGMTRRSIVNFSTRVIMQLTR